MIIRQKERYFILIRSVTTDNPVMNFLTIVCDIVILHFLWLLTSLPVLTIGASTTALYYTTMKCIRNGQGGVVKMFFKSFKDNFKQATGIGILALIAGFICVFDMYFAINKNLKSMMVIFTIMSLIYLFTVLYVFPLQAQFENTIKATIKNAFLLSIKNLPWTLLLTAITALMVVMSYLNSTVLGIMLICAAGLHAYLCSLIFVHIFREYMPEEDNKADEDFHIKETTDTVGTTDTDDSTQD